MNRPALTPPVDPRDPLAAVLPVPAVLREDWPAITSQHPRWWHVERVERCAGILRYVLIAECRTLRLACDIAARQLSQVRIRRWGQKRAPFVSHRPPREVPDR